MIMMRFMMMVMAGKGVFVSVLQSQPQCNMVGGMEMYSHANTSVVFHTVRARRARKKGVR